MNRWLFWAALLISGFSGSLWAADSNTTPADVTATVTIKATDPTASESGPSSGLFTVSRTGSTAAPLTVEYKTSGSAVAPDDYVPLTGKVVINAGSAAAAILVTPVGDTIAEESETVIVTLVLPTPPLPTSSAAYQVGQASSATVTIKDNDVNVAPLPTVSIRATAMAAEPETVGKITISRMGDITQTLQVNYEVLDIQVPGPTTSATSSGALVPAATPGLDYQVLPGSITIPAGKSSIVISIQPIDDQLVEGIEAVTLRLKTSASYNINKPDTASVFIADNDPVNLPPTVAIQTPKEAQSFTGPVDIQVAAQATDKDDSVKTVEFFANGKSIGLTTANPASASAVNPFQITWKSVGAGKYTLTAKATDERGKSTVSGAIHITVTVPTPPVVTVEATQAKVVESDVSHPGIFKVTRTGSMQAAIDVRYSLSGTAANGVDYVKLSGVVTLPAGQSSAEIQVVPIPDKVIEEKETVVITLAQPATNPTYSVSTPRTATITISDAVDTTGATLTINSPKAGDTFQAPGEISISVTAVDPKGYISRVEFFANDKSIGVSQLMFFQAPDPGIPTQHTLTWQNVPAGKYNLAVKALTSAGALVKSPAVAVVVNPLLARAQIRTQTDELAVERRFSFQTEPGRSYSIQASSDLLSWGEVDRVDSAGDSFDYVEAELGTPSHRFYRAVPTD
jgi:hypothetical protein